MKLKYYQEAISSLDSEVKIVPGTFNFLKVQEQHELSVESLMHMQILSPSLDISKEDFKPAIACIVNYGKPDAKMHVALPIAVKHENGNGIDCLHYDVLTGELLKVTCYDFQNHTSKAILEASTNLGDQTLTPMCHAANYIDSDKSVATIEDINCLVKLLEEKYSPYLPTSGKRL